MSYGMDGWNKPSGDLISRQAAIDVASGYCHPANIADELRKLPSAQPEITEEQVREYCRKRCLSVIDGALLAKYVNDCQDTISGMPSAQPERKRGHWNDSRCSVCGISRYNFVNILHVDAGYRGTWKYCPNCGADMRRVDDERV